MSDLVLDAPLTLQWFPGYFWRNPADFAKLCLMANGSTDEKQHAHELIDRMAPGQVAAVVGLLEIMLNPLARTLASAPYDDEPVSAEEARDLDEAKASLARGEGGTRPLRLSCYTRSSDPGGFLAPWRR